MKKLSIFTALACVLCLSMTVSASSQKKSPASDDSNNVDLIENAIIVDNLSLVSEKPDNDTDEAGIIFDDSFDNNILNKGQLLSSHPKA